MNKLVMIPFLLAALPCVAGTNTATINCLMPVPRQVEKHDGQYRLSQDFTIGFSGVHTTRLHRGATRFLRRLDGRTGLFFPQGYLGPTDTVSDSTGLQVGVRRAGLVQLGEDESYELVITQSNILLKSETDIGTLRGLETLLQLLDADADGYFFPACHIVDAPRFPWRGLLVDSCRHFMPMEMIKRTLDGLAAVKMNVLHWHLTEDQGFRVESRTYPGLHEMGSDGDYYTHEQIQEIIQYADDRGIRVVPEFDMPGHATSWLVAYPELASAPGPYEIERKFGIFKPTLNPASEYTYTFLEGFLTEMAALFPDEFIHIGGDENTGEHWDANPEIQAFMKENGIPDNHALQSYFNQRVLKILTANGKRMMGWDEILQPDLPTNIVIHSWRGREAMVQAAREGYQSILSNGYYIDLMQSAAFHYMNDPLPEDIELNDEERARVLGGEATMWAELVSPETVDSRIWPRTAAIAERLWSPGSIKDIDDMYRRLDQISLQLEELGLTHLKNRDMLMRRLARGHDYQALAMLADVVEPLERYQRHGEKPYTQFSPLTLLPDVALADAPAARTFNKAVEQYLKCRDETDLNPIKWMLAAWANIHGEFLQLSGRSPALQEAEPLSRNLSRVSNLGLAATTGKLSPENARAYQSLLEEARQPAAQAELRIVNAVEELVLDSLGLDAWEPLTE